MLELILVRHGETNNNKRGEYTGWLNSELNEAGINQAYNIRNRLSEMKIGMILSSPLKRAMRTAEIINESHNLDIVRCENLKEYNFGIWDGLTYDEIIEKYGDDFKVWINDHNYCIRGGESFREVYKRVAEFVDELVTRNTEGRFVVVTHLGCIRIMLVRLLGMAAEDIWHFRVKEGSISKIEIDHGYAFLTLLNG